MAARKTRQQTDRITVRLPTSQIDQINALVAAGMYRNTTDMVYNAVKELLLNKGSDAKKTIEAEQGLLELQQMMAKIESIKRQFGT